jgi:hypothetical protein
MLGNEQQVNKDDVQAAHRQCHALGLIFVEPPNGPIHGQLDQILCIGSTD